MCSSRPPNHCRVDTFTDCLGTTLIPFIPSFTVLYFQLPQLVVCSTLASGWVELTKRLTPDATLLSSHFTSLLCCLVSTDVGVTKAAESPRHTVSHVIKLISSSLKSPSSLCGRGHSLGRFVLPVTMDMHECVSWCGPLIKKHYTSVDRADFLLTHLDLRTGSHLASIYALSLLTCAANYTCFVSGLRGRGQMPLIIQQYCALPHPARP